MARFLCFGYGSWSKQSKECANFACTVIGSVVDSWYQNDTENAEMSKIDRSDRFKLDADGCVRGDDYAIGLPCLRMKDGITFEEFHGEAYYGMKDTYGLYSLLVAVLAKGFHPLTGRDVRLIRCHLHLSQPELARVLGTTRASVARWEATKLRDAVVDQNRGRAEHQEGLEDRFEAAIDRPIPKWADRGIRSYVAARLGLANIAERLEVKESKGMPPRDLMVVWEEDRKCWQVGHNTFGPGGSALADPFIDARYIALFKSGDPYGGRQPKKTLARIEGKDVEEVKIKAQELAKTMPTKRLWYITDYMDRPFFGPGYDLGQKRVERIKKKMFPGQAQAE
jgi:hypothetical protein